MSEYLLCTTYVKTVHLIYSCCDAIDLRHGNTIDPNPNTITIAIALTLTLSPHLFALFPEWTSASLVSMSTMTS